VQDKFTTNYALPDGSYGTINGGSYTDTGGTANLITGNETNGGNIYANDPAAAPNTAMIDVSAQYTSSGVGSAIPVIDLGTAGFYVTKVIVPLAGIAGAALVC
jgi:hypothetical protein